MNLLTHPLPTETEEHLTEDRLEVNSADPVGSTSSIEHIGNGNGREEVLDEALPLQRFNKWVKGIVRFAEKIRIEKGRVIGDRFDSLSSFFKKSMDLNQNKASGLAIIFLVLALAAAGALAYLFARELTSHRSSLAELEEAKHAEVQLKGSLDQLTKEVAGQREEIARLASDLKSATAKAAMLDTLRVDHKAELDRLRSLYEGQLTSLRNVMALRDDLLKTFESNFRVIRNLLGEGSQAAAASQPISGMEKPAPPSEAGAPVSKAANRPVAGSVMMINRDHRFIISNLSPSDGAQIGRHVQIYRNGTSIGQARIDRVYQSLSAATILSDDTLERVQKGDQVFLALA